MRHLGGRAGQGAGTAPSSGSPGCLPPELRQGLALAMLEDVLAALAGTAGLAGIVVVTIDPAAGRAGPALWRAPRRGRRPRRPYRRGRRGGAAAAAEAARSGMLTLPGDIPLVTAAEIGILLAAHRPAPSFTIVPSHDEGGSNAILVSPPDAVPLRFGVDSFFPHLRAAAALGIRPTVLRLPRHRARYRQSRRPRRLRAPAVARPAATRCSPSMRCRTCRVRPPTR